ncbi:Alpha/Beta hydrolase protein [Syncephalis plumigaleata]|nr:Alpha/Beta hydrolase protein [Syncephalis plumigaleata]
MKLHSFSLLLVLSLVTSTKALDDTVNAFVENVKGFKCTTWRVSHSTLHVAKKALGIASAMHTPEEIEKSLLRIDDHVKPQFQRPTNVTANSEEMIYRHLLYAAMTYCNDTMPAQRISNVHLGPNKRPLLVGGFNITSHYEKDNLSHYVAVNEQQQSIVLTFRGSTHFVNYRDAADIVRVRPNSEFFGETPNDAKVFEGYQYAATSQLVEAANALEQAYKTHPNYAVILVGHSLGGAIAHLAAIYIKRKRNIPVSLFTRMASLSLAILPLMTGQPL